MELPYWLKGLSDEQKERLEEKDKAKVHVAANGDRMARDGQQDGAKDIGKNRTA